MSPTPATSTGFPKVASRLAALACRTMCQVDFSASQLSSARNRTHRDRQNLMKIVQPDVTGARVIKPVPAFGKAIQNNPPGRDSFATR